MAGQAWAPSADGGYLANPSLSRKLRHAMQPMTRFLQFARQEPGSGKGKSDTLDFDKISNIATDASTSGISEGAPMPETKFTIGRGQLTLREYGNSIPYTGKLEALAQFDPNNIAQTVLRHDMAKILDAVAAAGAKRCQVTATPTGASAITIATESVPTTGAGAALNLTHMAEIRDYLKGTLKCEPYDGENYVCIGSVKALRGIKNSDDWKQGARFGDPERLFSGEVGRYDGIRYIETNNDLALDPDVGSGLGEAIVFGADPLVQGVAIAPEIRAKIPTDFGRSKGVAWYALLGFEATWRAVADASLTSPAQARAVWITSSATERLAAS